MDETIIELNNFLDMADSKSELGLSIKNAVKEALETIKYDTNSKTYKVFTKNIENGCYITKDILKNFVNNYCTGPKAIKDNIYYNINFKRNNYKYFTVSRDLEKSPRTEVKSYKATYDTIKKDPELLENYYSKKYSISNRDNIVTIMTEDDVLCLNCGCISDERLSDVPDKIIHLKNMKCPRCGSNTSSIVTFDSRLHKLSTFYRDKQK